MPRKGTVTPEVFSSEFPSTWRPLYEQSVEMPATCSKNTKDEQPKEDAVELFEDMKPMLYVMKLFGLFPFHIHKYDNKTVFRRCYLSMVYSIVFYMAMNVYAYYIGRRSIQLIRTPALTFDDLIFSLVLFIYLVPHIYLLPTHWKETPKVASFFNLWSDYQSAYRKVTGEKLILSCIGTLRIGKMAYIFACLIPVCAIGLSVAGYVMIIGKVDWVIPYYWYILTVLLLHAAWWWLTCAAQRSAQTSLNTALFKEPIRDLEEYRQLWLRLSNIYREIGNFMFDTYGHVIVLGFSAITMTLYGALSARGEYLRHLGLGICVLVFLIMLFVLADSAHRTWSKCGPEFCQELCCLSPADKKARKELKLFLLTVSMNSPKINLGGYVDIDRSFMVKFVSTIVTYLLVLLQFRLGVLSAGGTMTAAGAPPPIPNSP